MYYFLLGLIIYAFLLSIITKSRILSELLGVLLLSFLTLMIGFRYGVGIDYFNYEADFNMRYNSFSYEPIYSLLMYFIKTQFDKFHYLTFVMVFLTNIFIYLGLKKKNIKGIYLVLAIFIYSSNTALIFMNLMRQGVAVAIFFYASNYIKERKLIKFIIFMLLGAGFHYSILLLLPLYFIKDIKISINKYLVMVVLAYIFVYSGIAHIVFNFVAYRIPIYSHYYSLRGLFNEDVNILSLGVLLNIIFISLLMYFTKKEKKYQIDVNYYLIGTLINILAISSFMFDRIGIYLFIFGIAAIPKMIEHIPNKGKRMFFFILAVIVAFTFFAQSLFLNSETFRLEYKSIFLEV
ncbi:EpsG family protein [Chungangia koreensis]|uniref:EpsG family protein n=1 Tax=Chungangia koreensis TaxID=752657 RepID=A0ABV8X4M4_9LACT